MIPSNPRDRETRKSVGERRSKMKEWIPAIQKMGTFFFQQWGGTKIGGVTDYISLF